MDVATAPCIICAFLLEGKVQGVKLRRYVEAAGRHFGVGGYVINTCEGRVFGEAWVSDTHQLTRLRGFETWITGRHAPAVYTDVKPTPVGTAYPEKARVGRFVASMSGELLDALHAETAKMFSQFTMVRDDRDAATLLHRRKANHETLSKILESTADVEKIMSSVAPVSSRHCTIGSWNVMAT